MGKSISCKDAGKDCGWSASAETEEELIDIVKEHVTVEHKDIEMNLETLQKIKSLMKDV